MMNHLIYPSPNIPIEQESGSSEGSYGTYDTNYSVYSPNSHFYSDYNNSGKNENIDYSYWSNYSHQSINHEGNSSNYESYLPINESQTEFGQHVNIYSSRNESICQNQMKYWSTNHVDYSNFQMSSTPSNYRHYTNSTASIYSTNPIYESATNPWTTSNVAPVKYEENFFSEQSENLGNFTENSVKENKNESIAEESRNILMTVPPRNPFNGKTRTRDKYRIVYTETQRVELENEFKISHYISIPRKAALSLNLALSERQIKIWFQNRRAKERKLNKRRQKGTTNCLDLSNDANSSSETGFDSPNY